MKPKLTIVSARGSHTFSEAQRLLLQSVAQVDFVEATQPLSREAFVQFLSQATVAGLTPRGTPSLDPELLRSLPKLRAVCVPTTGTEWIDTSALTSADIRLINTPGFSTDSCAEFTWGLILSTIRKIPLALAGVPGGQLRGRELRGRTLGVVGTGNVGARVAELGSAFGMRVLGYDPRQHADIAYVDLDTLVRESDVISLHLPLHEQTRGLFPERRLRLARPGTLLINTARPALIEPAAVLSALRHGALSAYVFDTGYFTENEIAPYRRHPGVFPVPHVSWYTDEAVAREIELWTDSLYRTITELG